MNQTHKLTSDPTPKNRSFWVWVLLITLLGTGLRVYGLGAGSVWIDEMYTVRDTSDALFSASPTRIIGYLPTRWALMAQGITPTEASTGDYAHYLDRGIGPVQMRVAACLLGILSIPLIGLVARRVMGDRTTLILLLLLAISPWHIYWSQLARFYTQLFLFFALAIFLYADYLSTRSRWRFVLAMICVIGCHLTHPPALCIMAVFGLEWLIGLVREPKSRLGLFGWIAGGTTIAISIGVMVWELTHKGRGYGTFVGAEAQQAQNAAVIGANAIVMMTPGVVMLALTGFMLGWKRVEARVTYYALAALVPLAVIGGVALTGGFGHSRYTFICHIGWLALAAIGANELFELIRTRAAARGAERGGGRGGWWLASVPMVLVMLGIAPMLASYHTTGEHLREPWHHAMAYVAKHRQPGELVQMGRPEVGQYYLQDPSVDRVVGVTNALREISQGEQAIWVVRLSGNSLSNLNWKPQHDPSVTLKAVYATRSWMPYREVSVYRYDPAHDPHRDHNDPSNETAIITTAPPTP